MELLTLKLLPAALLLVSLAIFCRLNWFKLPALCALCLVTVIRSGLWIAEDWSLNFIGPRISALLMALATFETLQVSRFVRWKMIFCLGIGLGMGALSWLWGHSAEPLRAYAHVVSATMLALALIVSLLTLREPRTVFRETLMLLYVGAAITSSREGFTIPDSRYWSTTLSTEFLQVLALTGLLALGDPSDQSQPESVPVHVRAHSAH
jgi:hypothetical protein